MQKTTPHYLRQVWFCLHLANLMLAWNSTKSAPLNGHYPKLQFLTYIWFSCAQSHMCVLPACDAVGECRYRKAGDIFNSASDISWCVWCTNCADFSCLSCSLLNQTWPLYSLCHAWTMQNFDVVNFAAFWSHSWPLVHDARTMLTDTWCRALILCVSQSPEVRHGCCMWCSNSTELGCYVSRSLLKSDTLLYVMYQQCKTWMLCVSQSPEVRHGCRVWCINSAELGCYVSRSLEVKHGCCVWCIDSTEFCC